MSVFLAVDLDQPSRDLAQALIETHRANFQAKWLRIDKLHCTLVFLGHPTAEQVAAWVPVIDSLAARHEGFSLRLRGAGMFVTARAPSVLWLGVVGELEKLASLARDATQCLGGEQREFIPHVTLARARTAGAFDSLDLSGFQSSAFQVGQLSLYESSAEVYRVVHRAPLTSTVPHSVPV